MNVHACLPIKHSRRARCLLFLMEFALSHRSAPKMRVVNPASPPTPEPRVAWPEFKYIQVINEVKYSWASTEADVKVGRSGLSQELTIHTTS